MATSLYGRGRLGKWVIFVDQGDIGSRSLGRVFKAREAGRDL
jgi:hypothetical protein